MESQESQTQGFKLADLHLNNGSMGRCRTAANRHCSSSRIHLRPGTPWSVENPVRKAGWRIAQLVTGVEVEVRIMPIMLESYRTVV
jgi:hypothetical protein